MTSTYTVTRDADNSRGGHSDEDRAMAHELIYHGTDLEVAKQELIEYMTNEVAWLRRSSTQFAIALGRPSNTTDDRADILELAITEVAQLDPEPNKRSTIKTAGLVWTIARRES